ncbi:carbohydrate ABC transporter permease [Gryllotalpicola protaetiae]|uniref:Sugar ABC transporter permease n=1 Tax=Gryllotalpicola protaetiae TaxID=2419771 RepID=A0A387BJR4_9MICO|nr:sugar ABC transporter permease [Gryllotalpicola protaetiae]AYG04083.1 sugar ABC transporter permease [Gryllotalpicola protaetiae]
MSTETVSDAPNRARHGVGVSGSGNAPGRAKKRGKAIKFTGTFLAFALPSVVLLLLLNLYPLIYAAWQSLHFGDLVSQGDFVGLQNYVDVLTSRDFWDTAGFTLIFTVAGVFGSWAVGLGLALLLRTRIPLNGLWKVLLLLPWIVPTVVSATSWNWLLATPQSPGVIFAHAIGLGNVLFLADPTLAKVTVCVFKVWISFPFMMMMMSSALASVDTNVYEASKVDGAGTWQTFTRITLPMISRTTYISWILMTIFCVNDFPTVFLLLGQGGRANTLVVQAYESVFLNNQVGPGVATAFIMTIVLVVVSVVLYRQIQKVNIE